jgi:hypothetical protein
MKRQTIILDANILFPVPLCDFFMHLALTGAVRVRWSKCIEDEWVRNVIEKRSDLNPDGIRRRAIMMNQAIPDAMIEGFENLETSLLLPHANDRHVLAAAIIARADAIITKNLVHFPVTALAPYGVEALHPDEFVFHLLGLEPRPVIQAIRRQQANLKNPPKTITEVLATLEKQEMPQTVSWLRGAFDEEDWGGGIQA